MSVPAAFAGVLRAGLAQGEGAPAGAGLEDLPSYGAELVRMLGALGIVLALILVAGWLLPRWLARRRPAAPGRHMEVVETLRLDPRRVLYLVRVDGRLVLVGAGEGGLLHLESEDARNDSAAAPRTFAERLRDGGAPRESST